jgi:hypothetical protein
MTNQAKVAGHWTPGSSAPPREAFHLEHVVDPFTSKDVIGMVRHAGHAFVIPHVAPDLAVTDEQAQRFGQQYLTALADTLGLAAGDNTWIHSDVWDRLTTQRQANEYRFGWLQINWGASAPMTREPERRSDATLGSFWVDRVDDKHKPVAPRLLVLLAGNVVETYGLQFGSDVGLRIVIQVHHHEVRMHGVTLCGLSHRRAFDARPDLRKADTTAFNLVSDVNAAVSPALKCDGQVWISNLETSRTPGASKQLLSATGFALRWRKDGMSQAAPTTDYSAVKSNPVPRRARAYDFRVDVLVSDSGAQVVQVHRDGYIGSSAQAPSTRIVRSFVQDAASKETPPHTLRRASPALDDKALDAFRDNVELYLRNPKELAYSDDKSNLFETRSASSKSDTALSGRTVNRSPAGVVEIAPPLPQIPGMPDPILRSDEQASIETHVRAAELFERLKSYGMDPRAYFRFARLPLVQRARPAMRWAPDGELPNAEVRPFMGDQEADKGLAAPSARDRLQLLVMYGSADPMHRSKLPLFDTKRGKPTGRLKAQYLSVASDPRWAWHEFGHVLNFASTGELEFPFAHSAGDALAAIVADPRSGLATAQDPDAALRHVTFPWIEVPGRSHGRSALRGYGWCGCRNKVRLDFSATLERYHHSYFGEQMLSSSLFRLYRSLGGDTRGGQGGDDADEKTRLAASDYCVYLIMRAIALLGPDTLAPARTPDQFVSALIEADLGTANWDVHTVWPFNQPRGREMHRKGGQVHKVIRWAFEQQGLYATADPRATVDDVGWPPAVDVYIADRHPRRAHGNYAPIPLRATEFDWHVHEDCLVRTAQQLTVTVANRGSAPALKVGLRVWWGRVLAAGKSVKWDHTPMTASLKTVATDKAAKFQLHLPSAADQGKLWFLVSADAPADPSNLAEHDHPPSSWADLMELVAHDNNLALGCC